MISRTGPLAFFLAPILFFLTIPFLILALLFNEAVRLFVSTYLTLKYKGKIVLANGADGFWEYKKQGSTRNVLVYIVTHQGKLDFENVSKIYENRIQYHKDLKGKRPFEKFEKILTTLGGGLGAGGYACWKDAEDFDVRNHIRMMDKEKLFSVKDVKELQSKLDKDMDESRPQWEFVILPRYDDNSGLEKSILICRFLHAYMDGLSFVMLFKEHLASDFAYTIDPLNFRIPSWKKILFYINTFIYGPFALFLLSFVEKIFLKPWILRKEEEEESSPINKKHYTWADSSKPIDSEVLRSIRMVSDRSTVTNVISVAFASALAKVLPQERLVPELFVNELIAYLPYPNPNPQNRFAYFTYGVKSKGISQGLDEAEDYLERLRKAKRDSLKNVTGPETLVTYWTLQLIGRFPLFLLPIFLNGNSGSILLSNVPFSKTKCTFRNTQTEILEMGAWTPQPNDLGLSLTTISYDNTLKVCACADSKWLSEEELIQIINEIPKEIQRMGELLSGRNKISNKDNKDKDANDNESFEKKKKKNGMRLRSS